VPRFYLNKKTIEKCDCKRRNYLLNDENNG